MLQGPAAFAPATVSLRRFVGPRSVEVHLLGRPRPHLEGDDAVRQTQTVYSRILEALRFEGGGPEHILQERVFFQDIDGDLPWFLEARAGALGTPDSAPEPLPAFTFVGQPPADPGARLEVLLWASIPHDGGGGGGGNRWCLPACGCDQCTDAPVRSVAAGGQKSIHGGNILGSPGNPYEEAYEMFRAAEGVLREEGLDFRSVVRTWIYLRHMEEDYAAFNRARRNFFKDRGIVVRPASTGIQGAPPVAEHRFSLGFLAVGGDGAPAPEVRPISTRTMNEAWEYGSDFSRGMMVRDADKVALHISGTASVDEAGRTVHEGDLEAQAQRMLLNIESLLAQGGGSFSNVVSAVTYLKRREDRPRLRRVLNESGIGGFPNAVVEAAVCRPNLLCEMEVLALLPATPMGE